MPLLLVLSAAACSPPLRQAPIRLPDSFSRSGEEVVAERWWTELGDPALTTLIDTALANNFDILGAWSRLTQAEAVVRREGAGLFPSIDLEATTNRTELTQSAQQGSGAGGRNDVRLGLSASYELDLWGRIRSVRDAAEADRTATEYEVHTAAITVSAEIAKAWYELVEQRQLLAITADQVLANEQLLELLTLRFRRGLVPAADVLRQRQLVEAIRGDRYSTQARADVLEHRLATLVGQPPRTVSLPPGGELLAVPPLPATGLPVDLVDRRPDLRQAYALLLAADHRFASAKADRYPRLTISGSAALAAKDLRDLFDNWIATVAAGVVAPLIDAGRRSAEVDRTRAFASERLYQYAQAILVALREVEDALVQEERQQQRNASLNSQLATADAVVDRLRDQYLHGSIEYLDVLQALVSKQELERAVAGAQRQVLAFRIDLYRAIGGSFALPEPDLVARTPTRSDRSS